MLDPPKLAVGLWGEEGGAMGQHIGVIFLRRGGGKV